MYVDGRQDDAKRAHDVLLFASNNIAIRNIQLAHESRLSLAIYTILYTMVPYHTTLGRAH